MPELLLEILSEEIPARMQARAAEDLARLTAEALKPAGLALEGARTLYGPRRIALIAEMPAATPATEREEKGPRLGAPEQALGGFARKFSLPDAAVAAMRAATGASDAPVYEGEGLTILARPEKSGASFLLRLANPARSSAEVLAEAIPALIRRFPWPKSMRWGTSDLIWVRPMQRILCLLDGKVVPFRLGDGADDAHGLHSADVTEGHRIQSPGAFAVASAAEYEAGLRERSVIPDAAERERMIEEGITALAAAEGLEVVPDRGLLAEVAGLVEWPVPLLGRIDDAFMDLPPELMRTTMRVNQRYFALRKPNGEAAARFALVANIDATDGGAAIVGGNERVLRARLSDARFFWDLDRKGNLEAFLPKLDSVVFHAKLGTQGDRVRRLERLARHLAPMVGSESDLAGRAARLAKADLASGMVGEFPELQGVMGRYYALHAGEDSRVAEAVGAHYRPLGPGDAVPSEPTAIAVALADKLDQLAGFFAADERPTGSGDPYALRRAALGVIRIIRENGLRLPLADALAEAFFGYPMAQGSTATPEFGMAVAAERMNAGWKPPADPAHPPMVAAFAQGVIEFLAERLRVQMRAEGLRHDLVAAAFGTSGDDDLNRLLARADALRDFLSTEAGTDLVAAYRRAANILRIEEKKDGRAYAPAIDPGLLRAPEEMALAAALEAARPAVGAALSREDFAGAMTALAPLRAPVDAFFDRVTVNDPDRSQRANRLGLLALLRAAMDEVADIARIEG
ncbi:glycine--tRNA ligase subunit beta [Pararoseomonas sp. SCSIO 73927]|uniref:glycine--tRNA ligase subunit beta n=1 Tax=Pararoseomonas sp. SCSIO 73927 TaxID=3114537 RepID=UPI0030D104D7